MGWLDELKAKAEQEQQSRVKGDSGFGEKQRGFLPGSSEYERSYLDFLAGRGDTSGIPRHMLSSQYGHSARLASRAAMQDFETDPGLQRYRDFLGNMQSGGAGRKIRRAGQEATSRASAAQRDQVMSSFESQLGGGLDAGGLRHYTNEKMDNALAGQMGEAYRAAAMGDIESRFRSGQAMQGLRGMKNNLFRDIISTEMGVVPMSQKTTTGGSMWADVGSSLLGGLGGAFAGGLGGAAGSALGAGIFGDSSAKHQQGQSNRIPLSMGY